MTELTWRDVKPESKNDTKQFDVKAFYDELTVGSLMLSPENGWSVKIENCTAEYIEAETEKEAKNGFLDALENHCEDEISYFQSLLEGVTELRKDMSNENQNVH